MSSNIAPETHKLPDDQHNASENSFTIHGDDIPVKVKPSHSVSVIPGRAIPFDTKSFYNIDFTVTSTPIFKEKICRTRGGRVQIPSLRNGYQGQFEEQKYRKQQHNINNTPQHNPCPHNFNLLVHLGPRLSQITIVCFETLLTDEVIPNIVLYTNTYAAILKLSPSYSEKVGECNRTVLDLWNDVNADDIWIYTAIIILMGIVSKPQIHMYWSTDSILSTPGFSRLVGRDRFEDILPTP